MSGSTTNVQYNIGNSPGMGMGAMGAMGAMHAMGAMGAMRGMMGAMGGAMAAGMMGNAMMMNPFMF